MNKLKEKIKEFKEADKKTKAKGIVKTILFVVYLLLIAAIGVGMICWKNKEMAGADYRPLGNENGFEYPEDPNIVLPEIKVGEKIDKNLSWENETTTLPVPKSIIFTTYIVSDSPRWRCHEAVKINIYGTTGQRNIEFISNENIVFLIIQITAQNVLNTYSVRKSNGTYVNDQEIQALKIAKLEEGGYNTVQQDNVRDYLWAISYSSIYGSYYDKGYNYGFNNAGGIAQEEIDRAYDNGYNKGYEVGYGQGVNDTPTEFNPIAMIIKPVASFFSIKMFGTVGIGDFLAVAIFVFIALMFLKTFAGG